MMQSPARTGPLVHESSATPVLEGGGNCIKGVPPSGNTASLPAKREREDEDDAGNSSKKVATEEGSYYFQMFVQNIKEEESRKMKAESERLHHRIKELEDALATLKKERETEKKDNAQRRAELQDARNRAAQLEKQVNEAAELKRKAEAEVESLQLRITSLRSDVFDLVLKY
ncbi:uncharacterized protein EI97DRAFT_457405 [Westerdykella ornata]|uniref:Uncharacterized protein n=1 Tax=Westerdykella ornata TaxID=318751 RepID=A0A6A6JL47_WESOR|nr:uncharacterized protein EI97DRAFT_457405 [Westerdykella ornata]KAF2277380.1 hypothetical protein EI97DRAFT_457405 [Westerdykella ornata]